MNIELLHITNMVFALYLKNVDNINENDIHFQLDWNNKL